MDKRGWFPKEEEEAFVRSIDERLRAAVKVAEETPAPKLETLFEDVFEKKPWYLEEQEAELLAGSRPVSHH